MQEIKPFVWQAQYYETDQMGIVHHSNYIRWMESARTEYLALIGLPYDQMEAEGIISPVISVNCEYKAMVRFREKIEIEVWIKSYNGVKLIVGYRMISQTSKKICTLGESSHCFLTKEGEIVSLKRSYPEWDKILADCIAVQPEQKNRKQ